MKQISLLWELQNYEINLEKISKRESLLDLKKKIQELKKEHESIRKTIGQMIEEYKNLDRDITKNNLKSKDLYYEIKERQNKMYGGTINNMKILAKIESEFEELKKEIHIHENEIIDKMEKKEIMEKDILKMKKRMGRIEEMYKNEKNRYYIEKENVEIQQNKLRIEIENLQQKIEKSLLVDYKELQQNIKPPLAKVEKGVCTGCSMSVSTILLKEIYDNQKTHSCENCGRILYLEII